MKISLIGTGRVGSTLAFQLLLRGLGKSFIRLGLVRAAGLQDATLEGQLERLLKQNKTLSGHCRAADLHDFDSPDYAGKLTRLRAAFKARQALETRIRGTLEQVAGGLQD